MKKSLLISIFIHSAVIVAVVVVGMMLPSPSKEIEPIQVKLLSSPPPMEPEETEPREREPLPPPRNVSIPPQPKPQPYKPVMEKMPVPVMTAAVVPNKVADFPAQPLREPVVATVVKAPAPVKDVVPLKAAAEPAKPDPKVKEAYLHYLRQTIDERKVYPKNAKRLRQTGIVLVKFTLMAEGTITNVSVAGSSGFELLDQAASDLLKDISRVNPLPKELGHEPLTLSIPIQYTLR